MQKAIVKCKDFCYNIAVEIYSRGVDDDAREKGERILNVIKPHISEPSELRREAGGILAERGCRLLMIMAEIVVMSVVMLYMTVGFLLSELALHLFALPEEWNLFCAYAIMAVWDLLLTLFAAVPLFYGLFYIGAQTALQKETVLLDVFHSFSSRRHYLRALRMAFATMWRVVLALLAVALTAYPILWITDGHALAILFVSLLAIGEIALALLLSKGGFFTAYYAYMEDQPIGMARKNARRAGRVRKRQITAYVLDYLPWLLLCFVTAGVLLVADLLPRMILSYFLLCRDSEHAIELEECATDQNQIIQSEENTDHE